MTATPSMKGVPNNTVDENGIRWRRTRCFMCHMGCGIWCGVDTKTGRLVELRPNDDEGSVLRNRLGEKGERAEDRWEEISYDQALDEIAEKLHRRVCQRRFFDFAKICLAVFVETR